MKKQIYILNWAVRFFSVSLILSMLISCDNILDNVKDLSNYPGVGTFDDLQTSKAYLSALYANTLGGWPVNMGNNADEGAGIIGPDWVTTNNGTMKYWPYDVIRRINIMLEELPEGKVSDNEKKVMIGQAKFLRAFHYFKMVYYHGGVPIIKTPQNLTDDLEVKRNTTKECFDFIIEDLNDAISVLPDKYSGADRGRIDKASALAFKGRVLYTKHRHSLTLPILMTTSIGLKPTTQIKALRIFGCKRIWITRTIQIYLRRKDIKKIFFQ